LFAGRKLLVADDSPYYQTVLGLTFTDEGMEVATAGSGQEALEKLEQCRPDVILASVSMPGMGGYELCDRVKQSERFDHIPVMLLVGLHEPFDQAEARRVGADDVVTKPFQSIRQLVSRVGTLLGGKAADAEDTGHEYSTLGITRAEAGAPTAPDHHEMAETNVPVFVEAASMTDHGSSEVVDGRADDTGAADVELQTADTQRLERIDDEPAMETPIKYAQDDTREMPPVIAPEPLTEPLAPDRTADPATENIPADSGLMMSQTTAHLSPAMESVEQAMNGRLETTPVVEPPSAMLSEEQSDVPAAADAEVQTSMMGTAEMNEEPTPQAAPPPSAAIFNDALLDLGDFNGTPSRAVAEDLVLDLEYEEAVNTFTVSVTESAPETVAVVEVVSVAEVIAVESVNEDQPVAVAELQEWAIVAETPAEAAPVANVAVSEQGSGAPVPGLTPEVIDAIARRAVEHLSEKVVREIAWEVVPELAELLIKQKLDEPG
jgi:CheY-like chemotaxis protein